MVQWEEELRGQTGGLWFDFPVLERFCSSYKRSATNNHSTFCIIATKKGYRINLPSTLSRRGSCLPGHLSAPMAIDDHPHPARRHSSAAKQVNQQAGSAPAAFVRNSAQNCIEVEIPARCCLTDRGDCAYIHTTLGRSDVPLR